MRVSLVIVYTRAGHPCQLMMMSVMVPVMVLTVMAVVVVNVMMMDVVNNVLMTTCMTTI